MHGNATLKPRGDARRAAILEFLERWVEPYPPPYACIARKIGCSANNVYYHVNRLVDAGKVYRDGRGSVHLKR